MGKHCSIEGCKTGRNYERADRKKRSLRQLAYFRPPKNNDDALRTWSARLGQVLSQSDSICEIHFSKNDVIKYDTTRLPDGSVNVIPRKIFKLRVGAVPISSQEQNDVMMSDDTEDSQNIQGLSHMERLTSDLTTYVPAEISHEDDVMEFDEPQNSSIDESTTNRLSGVDTLASELTVHASLDSNHEESIGEEATEQRWQFVTDDVVNELQRIHPPEGWSCITGKGDQWQIAFVYTHLETLQQQLQLRIHSDLSISMHTPGNATGFNWDQNLTCVQDIGILLAKASAIPICHGTGIRKDGRAKNCRGIVESGEYKNKVAQPRCRLCRALRVIMRNWSRRTRRTLPARYAELRHRARLYERRFQRAKCRERLLRETIVDVERRCAAVSKEKFMSNIADMPLAQQLAVQACFDAVHKSAKQRRYVIDWVYEALLMRIQSPKLYEHLRRREILPLPCQDTLNTYIAQLEPSFGFQKAIFDLLRMKSIDMDPADRRGSLLVDEMALSEGVTFDEKSRCFTGFVDLGEHTPPEAATIRGDHALVFMFQPYRGKWVQVLGCFLSRHATTSAVLKKLLLESVLLVEGSGFFVDGLTMDGASWNHAVWKLLGITGDQVSCAHPCDPTRRLWMFSDFPHLLKCMRNGMLKQQSFLTEFGVVRKRHWEDLLREEGYAKANLKIAYQLSPAHLNPKGFQSMNVPLAFQLFSDNVRVAMELFSEDPKYESFQDAQPTIRFIAITRALINAMMSRTPIDALRPADDCKRRKAIQEFLKFLQNWEKTTTKPRRNGDFPISDSTLLGLKVTLQSTLELSMVLHEQHGYDFLMTSRLNQDALERFFGMMRNACGCNDHPEPKMFADVFRLLSSYSLVKPPRGSNITGSELLAALVETKESMAAKNSRKTLFFEKVDALLESRRPTTTSGCVIGDDHSYDTPSQPSHHHLSSHDYDVTQTSELVQSYMAGYVARKISKFTKCPSCIHQMKSRDICERDKMIEKLDRGALTYPSEELFKLTETLEKAVLEVVGTETVNVNTLWKILDKFATFDYIPFVGCEVHAKDVTKQVIDFYLVMRARFLARSVNQNFEQRKTRQRQHRKNARL